MRALTLESVLPEAERIALKYFRADGLSADNKLAKGFDPVTIADREIETELRNAILATHPDDAILGEEFANQTGTSGYEWVIDPIDGTRAFIIGAPSFTVLVAVVSDEGFDTAVISQPFTGERFWRKDGQSLWQRGNETRPLNVSTQRNLSDAILATTFPEIGTLDERTRFSAVRDQVKLTRYGMDAYAYALVAMGHIDLVIEAGLKPYDYSAPWAVIEAAGGVVTNWEGNPPSGTDRVIMAATQELADQALELINR